MVLDLSLHAMQVFYSQIMNSICPWLVKANWYRIKHATETNTASVFTSETGGNAHVLCNRARVQSVSMLRGYTDATVNSIDTLN